ncbi:MAG: glycosyltransferase family 2 protein [Abitibacteriaceae bacterium]|nr:glycosyltransferase family 2 protein [Abditibacteriaceae bacterium]MBV9864096.1 glycosyltransferase family 2 protein [Abditibacteriaceae bacterium]
MLDEAQQPLVSIVLPTYNRAERLPRALRHCLQQTYSHLEVIVVDDGSKDDTPQVVAQFQKEDARVRYVRQDNQGLPAALNTGFRESRGEYLTWTSDDNWYHAEAIAIMARALEQRPTVSFVYCDYKAVDGAGNLLRPVPLAEPEVLMRENCVGACFLYRRRVYEQIGDYDCNLFLAEDYDYWLRVRQHFQMVHIPDVCPYSYGWHEDSLTERRLAGVASMTLRARLKNAANWQEKLVALAQIRPFLRILGRPLKKRLQTLLHRENLGANSAGDKAS